MCLEGDVPRDADHQQYRWLKHVWRWSEDKGVCNRSHLSSAATATAVAAPATPTLERELVVGQLVVQVGRQVPALQPHHKPHLLRAAPATRGVVVVLGRGWVLGRQLVGSSAQIGAVPLTGQLVTASLQPPAVTRASRSTRSTQSTQKRSTHSTHSTRTHSTNLRHVHDGPQVLRQAGAEVAGDAPQLCLHLRWSGECSSSDEGDSQHLRVSMWLAATA